VPRGPGVAAERGRTLDVFEVPEREKGEVLAAFAAQKGEVTERYEVAVRVHFEESAELIAKAIDAVGVAVIVGGGLLATTHCRAIRSRLGSAVPQLPARCRPIDIGRPGVPRRGRHHPDRRRLTDVSWRRRACDHRLDPNVPQLYVGARDRWPLAVATSSNTRATIMIARPVRG
jgi:hypothetical protein